MLGHPPYELNLWLPFTKVYDSNSMRLTSLKDSLNFIKPATIILNLLHLVFNMIKT